MEGRERTGKDWHAVKGAGSGRDVGGLPASGLKWHLLRWGTLLVLRGETLHRREGSVLGTARGWGSSSPQCSLLP